MSKAHTISQKELEELKLTRKKSKDIKEEKRLHAVELKGQGYKNKEIAEKLDTTEKVVSNWVSKYKREGIEGLLKKKQQGNRRTLSLEQEKKFLSRFEQKAEKGQIITVKDIEKEYIKLVGHSIGGSQIYRVLKRHG